MQSNFRREYNNRSTSIQNSGRIGRTTRFEYVNRAGEPVNPANGKPYSRSMGSGLIDKRKRPLPIKKSGAMFGDLDPIPTDVTRDPPPRACFNCWQMGHSRRNCSRPKVARMCNNCGRRGEDLTTCPRCSRGYQRFLEHSQGKEHGTEDEDQTFPYSEDDEDNVTDDFLRNYVYQDQELDLFQDRLREKEHEGDKELSYQDQERYSWYQERDNSSSLIRDDDMKFAVPDKDLDHLYPERSSRDDSSNGRRRSESPSRILARRTTATSSSSNSVSSDPVHEILLLAKSIAHLSPETQDLIMRQVMAERKEQAHQRALQGHENTWS